MYALVVGVTRLTIAFVYQGESYCGDENTITAPIILANFHYMYFALFMFLSTGLLAVIISLLTTPPAEKYVSRWTITYVHAIDATVHT